MPNYQRHIVYLSDEQRQELFTNGTITVNGQTITYSDNDMYVTPQESPYVKPATGIPASDLAEGTVPVQDVQVNGTSVMNNGIANIPVADVNVYGVLRTGNNATGLQKDPSGYIKTYCAALNTIKSATDYYQPIVPIHQHESAFYGLAKAAGDSTQSASSNAVGAYTETAKSKIHTMLNGSVAVSGTTPSITGQDGIRYVCGEVSTISITPPASGIIDVVFDSGTTPAVLTIVGTVRWANGFDPDNLDANTTYEINIADGLGVVGKWT